jgi:hypothetical protein
MKIIHTAIRASSLFGILFPLILMVGLGYPTVAYAHPTVGQTQEIALDTVSVDIWPENDRPSVLVIMHVKLSAQVNLPAEMSIRIPAAAGQPFAVAWQSSDKALFELKYDTKAAKDWTEIEFIAPSSDIQIEYYDPTIKKTGSKRDFTFHWSEKYPVQNLTLQIQQPVNATNMTFNHNVGSGHIGDDGLTYYSLVVGNVNAGTAVDLAMSYNKQDDTLSAQQFQKAQPNQPIDGGASGRVAFDQFLPWGVGGLGLLLIAAGSFWYWKTGRAPSTQTASGRLRHSSARLDKPVSAAAGAGESAFCHQCGKKAGPGDVFCRACGTKLR